MAAVIRIKRHLKEDPLDAILLNCKRRKTEDCPAQDIEEELSTVLQFAGTVENPDEDVFKHIKKSTKSEAEEQFKKHRSNIVAKLRQQKQLAAKNNRFKVINSFRSSDTSSQQTSNVDLHCTIVDIETDENKENNAATKTSDSQYVYDLYYTNSDDFGEADLNELISVYPLGDGLVYDSQCKAYNESDSEYSEDSNAENNWRNDYPDEDEESEKNIDDNSINEDDMLQAINNVHLGEDLSSDEYEEAFLYDREEEEQHGESYSQFKNKYKDNFCYYEDDDGVDP